MWTPLILLCALARPDCAILPAPGYLSREDCQTALSTALETYTPPPNTRIVAATCFGWGAGA